jgi:hypothetical protein
VKDDEDTECEATRAFFGFVEDDLTLVNRFRVKRRMTGDDHGAQWTMAHPILVDTRLTVSNFTKELHYQLGQVQENGAPVYRYFDPYYRYSVATRLRLPTSGAAESS